MDEKRDSMIRVYSSDLDTEEQKRGCLWKILNFITVEPTIFFYIFPSTMYQLATMNLYLEKTCRVHLFWNTTVCDALSERKIVGLEKEEAEVQKYVSKMFGMSTFIQGFFPVCLILFLGAWSDECGKRKPLILAPIIGEIVAVILLILNTVYFDELPVFLIVISVSLPPALMGGWPCLLLGVYSHISSTSNDEMKTAKIGISSTIQYVAWIIGLGSSGFLLEPIGFTGLYGICLILLTISLIYGSLRIKDTDVKRNNRDKFCFDFFRFKYLKSTVETLLKNDQCKRKRNILLILALCIIVLGPMQGETAVCYLYTRLKFSWDELDFSVFFLAHSFGDIVGSLLAIGLLSKFFGWKDSSIGILALFTTISAEVMYALAPNYKYFYGGIVLDIFYTIPPIVLRSLLNKEVAENEFGRSNSIYGLIEGVVSLLFGPIYSAVYKHTIDVFAGSFYFLSIGMFSTGICLFIYFNKSSSSHDRYVEDIIDTEEKAELKGTTDLEIKTGSRG